MDDMDETAPTRDDIVSLITADRRSKMGRRGTTARSSRATHPHPSAPDAPPGNLVAALFDRIRDAASHV